MGETLRPLFDERLLRDLLLVLDLAGTFVFALSGAMLAVRRKLDFFGVLALSFAAGSAGGIIRDLLIGAVPPAAIGDWRYFGVAMAAGLIIFFWYSPISRLHRAILISDAAGLALFAVAGAEKAITFGLNPVMAALLGMLTGIGGGIVRDLLVARTPAVLQSDLYAVAALAGRPDGDRRGRALLRDPLDRDPPGLEPTGGAAGRKRAGRPGVSALIPLWMRRRAASPGFFWVARARRGLNGSWHGPILGPGRHL